jgi:Pyruvate/2-oxoacid:ferredoxin oxidoreductase gamma subunit
MTNRRAPVEAAFRKTSSLFDRLPGISKKFGSKIEKKLGVVLAGSAGGGVQSAAMLLANAGTLSGLFSTMKGEYPVTVGTGFSIAEVILSTEEIHYTGLDKPDVLIIVSEDGLAVAKHMITPDVMVFADDKLETGSWPNIIRLPFVQEAGKRGAALSGLSEWIRLSSALELESLVEAIGRHKHAESLLKALFALEKRS